VHTRPDRRSETPAPRLRRAAAATDDRRRRRRTHAGPKAAPRLPNLDRLAERWQRALDAADSALAAEVGFLPRAELGERVHALTVERRQATRSLEQAAAAIGRDAPWLSPVPVTRSMIGLPPNARACLFDLDDVLTNSGVLHAWAWSEVFDELLLRRASEAGTHFVPFDRSLDYRRYVAGRTRLEGIHVFLASRGIRIPEGRPGDPSDVDTAFALAARKSSALTRDLHGRVVTAVAGARRYLQAVGHAGLTRTVVSASANTALMLELAGLESLVDDIADAAVIERERLRSRPAPDVVLAACARLGVQPVDAVVFTREPPGIAAARAAGATAIAVTSADPEMLAGYGPSRVVPSLGALLDRRIAG